MAKKQSTSGTSTLASDVLAGRTKPTPKQSRTLAASVLGQDEKKGNSPTPPAKAAAKKTGRR